MENLTLKLVVCGIFFLLMILTGVLLSKKGKPYQKSLLAIHKILSLITIILSILLVIHPLKVIDHHELPVWFLWIGGGMYLLSFASGVVLSFEKPMPLLVTRVHKLTSLLLTVSIIATAYLIVS